VAGINLSTLSFVRIPSGNYELGWRPRNLDAVILDMAEEYWDTEGWETRRSPARCVTLSAFDIARDPVRIDSLLDPYDLEGGSIREACGRLNAQLAAVGLRLPTEDEFEAACGQHLFYFGNNVPEGDPYSNRPPATQAETGLRFVSDSYKVELVEHVFKLGDGGQAVCGGAPWPLAWLTMATAFREWASSTADSDAPDVLAETLEDAFVRPVRMASIAS